VNAVSESLLLVQNIVLSRGRTVFCGIARPRAILPLLGRPLSYVLTLHVEEKGGQRRTRSYHVPSPNLITGWRGEMRAEGEKKIGKVLHVKARSHLVISSEEMSYILKKVLATALKPDPSLPPPPPPGKIKNKNNAVV
jgi:hypothetical protein